MKPTYICDTQIEVKDVVGSLVPLGNAYSAAAEPYSIWET